MQSTPCICTCQPLLIHALDDRDKPWRCDGSKLSYRCAGSGPDELVWIASGRTPTVRPCPPNAERVCIPDEADFVLRAQVYKNLAVEKPSDVVRKKEVPALSADAITESLLNFIRRPANAFVWQAIVDRPQVAAFSQHEVGLVVRAHCAEFLAVLQRIWSNSAFSPPHALGYVASATRAPPSVGSIPAFDVGERLHGRGGPARGPPRRDERALNRRVCGAANGKSARAARDVMSLNISRSPPVGLLHPIASNGAASASGEQVVNVFVQIIKSLFQLWDLAASENSLHGPHKTRRPFSPTGTLLFTICRDRKLRLFDPDGGAVCTVASSLACGIPRRARTARDDRARTARDDWIHPDERLAGGAVHERRESQDEYAQPEHGRGDAVLERYQ
ncbi:Coronin [Mycena sanguinolenta]|uniref:Coronin n=1 Tax=Mycena sanguinolenta TaxID=230812 RepID=A0A8H7DEL0_9AGAR|nr:Coronin [Mycena sanguinolenta]